MTLFDGIQIVCPRCKGEVREDGTTAREFVCVACDARYPVIVGIPDMRVFADPYISIEDDRKKGMHLAERIADLDFPDALKYYYSITPVVPPQHAAQYSRSLLGGAARASAAITRWESHHDWKGSRESDLLEIGCGTAPLVVAAVPRFRRAVGTDIAFRWLVLGRKRLADAGLSAPLICACAEALPFPPGSFDRVVGESVLESVRDQDAAMGEAARVLRAGGLACFAVPNQFSLGPDPHIGVPMGGYLPQAAVNAIAKRAGAIPPRRRLLNVVTVRRLLARAGFRPPKVSLPDVPPGTRLHLPKLLNAAVGLYHLVKRLPVGKHLLYLIGPMLYVVAEKPGAAGRPGAAR